ncbi:MAG: hypothetical protein PHU51_04510 [Candidatus Nanoarchaeia archaeon]|nr:hypothetical protein [Candidatus Nanoarchaeia archaeon]
MNIFRIKYTWYEGEEEESLLAKDITEEEFEKDLIQAKNYAQSLIGLEDDETAIDKYSVDCLPNYYAKIIWYLINKLYYFDCAFDKRKTYFIKDDCYGKKIIISKRNNIYNFTKL